MLFDYIYPKKHKKIAEFDLSMMQIVCLQPNPPIINMARIKHTEGLSREEILRDIDNGGKFVVYQYTISVIFMTFNHPSDIYFIRAGESAVTRGPGWSILTFFVGWCGFPWGPVHSIGSLYTNFSGGRDITPEIRWSLTESSERPDFLHEGGY